MVYTLPISPFAMYGIIASVGNGMVPLIYILGVVAMGCKRLAPTIVGGDWAATNGMNAPT